MSDLAVLLSCVASSPVRCDPTSAYGRHFFLWQPYECRLPPPAESSWPRRTRIVIELPASVMLSCFG